MPIEPSKDFKEQYKFNFVIESDYPEDTVLSEIQREGASDQVLILAHWEILKTKEKFAFSNDYSEVTSGIVIFDEQMQFMGSHTENTPSSATVEFIEACIEHIVRFANE